MKFIKENLVMLLCGVCSVGFIAVGILGMRSDTVSTAMAEALDRSGGSKIRGLTSGAKNDDVIAKEKLKGELFEREYGETVEEAKRINRREPLMGGVFPKPDRVALFRFKEEYGKAYAKIPVKISGGTLPTPGEIEDEVQNVADLRETEQERAEELAADSDPTSRTPAAPVAPQPPPVRRGEGGPSTPYTARTFSGTGLPVAQSGGEPKYDPVYRARVNKAKEVRCYYDVGSFHASPILDMDDAPTPADAWFAQLTLWIMEDVTDAIAAINKEAADAVAAGDAFIEQMPIKRVVAMDVLGYETAQGRIPAPARAATAGAGRHLFGAGNGPTHTGRKSNEQYDVVRFALTLVVDQRDLLKIVDRISRENFFTCVGLSYQQVNRVEDELKEGYFYGTDPVIRATLDFEAYLSREVFQPLMPDAILELLGIKAKEPE